jgi:peptidoglycan-associated lipoprotein
MFILRPNSFIRIVALAAMSFLAACSGKKMAKVTPPVAAPPPPAPIATLSAKPDVIQQGQSAVLTWQTANATDITIEGVGPVSASGSRSVSPTTSRTYTLVARGAGGTGQAAARITVNPAAAQVMTPQPNDIDQFAKNVKDVFFNFDDSKIRMDQVSTTQNDGSFLSQHSNVSVLIEGHCDDRGSEIYNLALGESRANAVKQALIQQGVDPSRIKTVSYGKEKPFCTQENEDCWRQNRRDHFVFQH